MPPPAGLAGLRIGDDDSRPSSARSSSGAGTRGPRPLEKADSFDVSATNTFSAEDLQLRGSRGMEGSSGVVLSDLTKEKLLGKGASGRVYLMKHSADGSRYFALKELTNALADSAARHMALNEVSLPDVPFASPSLPQAAPAPLAPLFSPPDGICDAPPACCGRYALRADTASRQNMCANRTPTLHP